MEITLELPPETEARLISYAAAQGVSVEELLKNTIEMLLAASDKPTNLITEIEQPLYQTATTEEWVDAFTTWAKSHSIDAPLLSDEAISRESIYREREDRQL